MLPYVYGTSIVLNSIQYESMPDHTKPEIQRVPLTELCLRTKAIAPHSSIIDFISKTIQPPPNENLRKAIDTLMRMGALNVNEELTRFGEIAVKFPIDCRLVKASMWAIVLRCFEPIMRIVAMLTVKSPFLVSSKNKKQQDRVSRKLQFAINAHDNDYRTLLNVYDAVYGLESGMFLKAKFCTENNLSYRVLQEAKATVESIKKACGRLQFWHTQNNFGYGSVNRNQRCHEFINACLTAALYPNVSRITRNNGDKLDIKSNGETIVPHTSSVLSRHYLAPTSTLNQSLTKWLVFKDKVQQRSLTVSNSAVVPAMTIVMFAGQLAAESPTVLCIDDFKFLVDEPRIAELILNARQFLEKQLRDVMNCPSTYGYRHEEGDKYCEHLLHLLNLS